MIVLSFRLQNHAPILKWGHTIAGDILTSYEKTRHNRSRMRTRKHSSELCIDVMDLKERQRARQLSMKVGLSQLNAGPPSHRLPVAALFVISPCNPSWLH